MSDVPRTPDPADGQPATAAGTPARPGTGDEPARPGTGGESAGDAGSRGPDRHGIHDPGAAGSGGPVSEADLAAVAAQLGRPPRGIVGVAHRCPCGLPDVVTTAPRLPDGTPFPTLYYLTCPRAASAVGRMEAGGMMREMTDRLAADPELAGRYRAAHEDYLRRRGEIADVPEIDAVSAGGMPDRVKCLHVHLAHALAAGPGVNPFGDEVADQAGAWWRGGPCVTVQEV